MVVVVGAPPIFPFFGSLSFFAKWGFLERVGAAGVVGGPPARTGTGPSRVWRHPYPHAGLGRLTCTGITTSTRHDTLALDANKAVLG